MNKVSLSYGLGKIHLKKLLASLLPVDAADTVFEGHQKSLPHRKLQVFCLCDDQHVWAGQFRTEVVEVDPAVIRHQTNTDI